MPKLAGPFDATGEWLRGNLHVHTTNSDGAMSPEMLVAHYDHAGWDFLALTDHWRVSDVADRAKFPHLTVIPSIEVNTGPRSTEVGTNYHVVGLNMAEDVPRREGLTGTAGAQWLIDAIREQGGEAVIAHPYWSGLTLRDVEGLRQYLALEVYNADTEVHIGRGNSQVLWDDLLGHGIPTLAVAVDDSHRPGHDSLRAWTVVRAADRSAGAIMAALSAGHFYASCGPEIYDVRWEPAPDGGESGAAGSGEKGPGALAGGTVTVRCSPARSITLVADATKGGRLNAGALGMALRARRRRSAGYGADAGHGPEGTVDGQLLTGGEFTLTGQERYARIQVEDERGRCAWTNPLFVNPLLVNP
ncbi:MAG: CehA/McbA family metallohydrolase [Chloroflexota bacterium]|nr:CehA/McbA family metallohydrolase [Chloroflexota bacterium]